MREPFTYLIGILLSVMMLISCEKNPVQPSQYPTQNEQNETCDTIPFVVPGDNDSTNTPGTTNEFTECPGSIIGLWKSTREYQSFPPADGEMGYPYPGDTVLFNEDGTLWWNIYGHEDFTTYQMEDSVTLVVYGIPHPISFRIHFFNDGNSFLAENWVHNGDFTCEVINVRFNRYHGQ